MLALMMFLCGVMELYGIATWSSLRGAKLTDFVAWSNRSEGREASAEDAWHYMKDAGLIGVVCRSLFAYAAMISVALFAFKATFFLMLPIWLASIFIRPSWRRNRYFYIIDNSICATLYFMAAWVVA